MPADGPPSILNPPTPQTPPARTPVLLEYPSTIGKGTSDIDNYMMFEAFDFKTQRQTLNIALYIPGGALNTSYKSDYESVALGGLGAAAGDVASVVQKGMNSSVFEYGYYGKMEDENLDIRKYISEKLDISFD